MKAIRIACTAAALIPTESLVIIQGDLKSLSTEDFEKLRDEIVTRGFSFAIHVWKNEKAEPCVLDGTQRLRVVRHLVQHEGYSCPALPVVYVEASSYKEAILKLLAGAGAYGKPEGQGLYELMAKAKLALAELKNVKLPGVEMNKFAKEYFDPPPSAVNGEDNAPEPPKVAKTKLGELWLLGDHRLLIDDCTVRKNVERLMDGKRAALWSSDPPYGINHVDTSQEKGQSDGYGKIQNDDLQFDELKKFLEAVIRNSIEVGLAERFAFYMWHAMKMQSYAAAAAAAAAAAGILFHRQIIWVKPSLVFGRGQYHWRHELCLMGWLQGKECPFYGERNQTTVWNLGRENDKIHPTQKPVSITEIPISNHTKPGEIVLDPFLGSGSTIVACEKTGRRGYGTEIEPVYGDVILSRWAQFTSKDPVREDGTKWSAIAGPAAPRKRKT